MEFNIGVHIGGYTGFRHDEDGRHEVWVETFSIQAVAPSGHVWALVSSDTGDEATAQAMLAGLGDCNPTTAPERWNVAPPVYGSDAWGSEDEYELACFEADCFDEPRPRWG